MIHISAVICTYNRADCLARAIKSLVNQTLPKENYEILIVDNASTDSTKDIIRREFSGVPNLSYFYEPVLGIARARNTGWNNAKGTYVCYLDDDAVASPEWLEKIIEVFRTTTLKIGCVGGRIDPVSDPGLAIE